MEDKIRYWLWGFLGSPLSVLFILGGWFMCIMSLVYKNSLLAVVGLGIIIFEYFLVILLGILDDRDCQRKSKERIKELDEFRERMRGEKNE